MHGYIDSIDIPLHLPASAFKPSTTSSTSNNNNNNNLKGKGKATVQEGQYDVVTNWTPTDRKEVERMVKMASILGYSTLLLNISIPPTFDPSKLLFPTPLFPEIDPRTAKPDTEKTGLVLQLWRINVENYSDEAVKGAGQKGWYGFANSTAPLYPKSTTLLSVQPTSFTSFSHVALSLSPPSAHSPTLITLDPSNSPRLPFPLKRGLISTLSRSGVSFEIVFRGITKQDLDTEGGDSSGKRRRNWISGAREIVRATEGKGIVLISGAKNSNEMRGPQDLINLCSLIGMPPVQAKDSLSTNPQRSIMRGLSLRSTYRGVVSNPVLKTCSTSSSSAITSTNNDESSSLMEVEEEDSSTTRSGDVTSTMKKRQVEAGNSEAGAVSTKQNGKGSVRGVEVSRTNNGKSKKRKV
ncbi:hypothetical protein JCM3765_005914 [Sporobolomyces pararoseus]